MGVCVCGGGVIIFSAMCDCTLRVVSCQHQKHETYHCHLVTSMTIEDRVRTTPLKLLDTPVHYCTSDEIGGTLDLTMFRVRRRRRKDFPLAPHRSQN